MIELSASTAFMLYLAFTLTILMVLGVTSYLRSRKKLILPAATILCICEYCHHTYVADSTKKVSQCPQCQSFNQENPYKAS